MPPLFAMCAFKATLPCLMLQANGGRTWPSWVLHSHQGCTRLLHLLQTHSSTCKKLRSLKFWNNFHNKVRVTNLGTRRATPFPFSSLFLSLPLPPFSFLSLLVPRSGYFAFTGPHYKPVVVQGGLESSWLATSLLNISISLLPDDLFLLPKAF